MLIYENKYRTMRTRMTINVIMLTFNQKWTGYQFSLLYKPTEYTEYKMIIENCEIPL